MFQKEIVIKRLFSPQSRRMLIKPYIRRKMLHNGNNIPPDVPVEDSEESLLIYAQMHDQRSPEAHLLKWEDISGWRAPVKPTSSETSPALPITTSSGSPMVHYPPLPKAMLLGSSFTQPLSCRVKQERSGKHPDSGSLSSDKIAQTMDQYLPSSSNGVPPKLGKRCNTVSSAQASFKIAKQDTELPRQHHRNSRQVFIKDEPQRLVSEVRMQPLMQQNSSRLGKQKVNDSSHNLMHNSLPSLPPVKKEPESPLPSPQNSRCSFLAPSSSNCAPPSQRYSLVKVELQSPTQSRNCIPLYGPFAYNFGWPNQRASFQNMAASSSRQFSLKIRPQSSHSNSMNPMLMTPSSSTYPQNNGGNMSSRNNIAFPLVPEIKQEIPEFLVPQGLPMNLHNRWLSRGTPTLSSQNFMNDQRPLTIFYETGSVGGTQWNNPNPQLGPSLQPWSTTPWISNHPSLQTPFQGSVFPRNSALGEGSSGRNNVGQINYQHQALAATAQESFGCDLQNASEVYPSLPNFMNID